MRYAIGIVAHLDRLERAERLADLVDARHLSYDDGTKGCTGNHLFVWDALAKSGLAMKDWGVVLEDDAEPIPGFSDQLQAALAAAPAPIVSLYLGTGYPVHWQGRVKRAVDAADSWIVSDSSLIHAVGVAIKADLIADMLDSATSDGKPLRPIDEKISAWARASHHFVAYTQPSLVDHADDGSIIGIHPDGMPRTKPRKAWKVGGRENWRSRPVLL